jgi:ADP-ribosylglycohydrolase
VNHLPDAVPAGRHTPVEHGTPEARQAAPSREDRYAGALLGVHVGDALGATCEFQSWAVIRVQFPDGVWDIVGGGPFDWPAGHATDDTDLTRAVLLAYLDALTRPGVDVVTAAADHMLAWLDGYWPGRQPGSAPRDIGGATRTGLQRYRATGDPRQAGAGSGAAGNGSLMRAIPTALAVPDRAARIRQSMDISAITHDDVRCTVACAAYNEIAAALLDGTPAVDAVEAGVVCAGELGQQQVADAIGFGRALNPAVLAATGNTYLDGDGSGYVLDSLALSVAAVLDPRPFPDVLVDIVRVGNDTDTNAAIAGGLLGARDGLPAIPTRWVQALQFRQEFLAAAHRFAATAPPGSVPGC